MKITRIGQKHCLVISHDDGVNILVSHTTPVACYIPGIGYLRTTERYSVTTTRHVNQWCQSAKLVPQEVINQINDNPDQARDYLPNHLAS